MTTKIRIQQPDHGHNKYAHMYFQILDSRYKSTSDWLEVIGTIKFQKTVGEDGWYGMSFEVNTDNPDHLLKMGKVAKYIKDNVSYDAQPEEIFQAIGGVLYMHYNSNFIPASYAGMKFFKVMNGSTYYSSIVTPNEIIARKKIAKLGKDGLTLVFDSTIPSYQPENSKSY